MMLDDVTRLILAAVAFLLLVGCGWLWRVVQYPGRRGVLIAFTPALGMMCLFSLAAGLNWWSFDVRRWLSQATTATVLAAIGVALSAIRDTERFYDD